MTRKRDSWFALVAVSTMLLSAMPAAADTFAFRSEGLSQTVYLDPVPAQGAPAQAGPETTWPNHTVAWWYNGAGAPSGLAEPAAVGAIQAAMEQWSANCGVHFVYRGAGHVATAPLGEAVVGWNRRQPSAASTRVSSVGDLAVLGSVEFNPTLVANADALARAALHAAGHVIGLDHAEGEGEVMSGPPESAYSDAAELGPEDIAGCRSLYGAPSVAKPEARAAVLGAPVCTPATANASPALNTFVSIASNCSGGPTTYSWSGGCMIGGSTCYAMSSVSGARTYTVTASNAYGSSTPMSVTLNWGNTAPTPPQCTVAISNSAPAVNTNVTFTANCTNAPTGYTWTGCSSTTNTCTTTSAAAGAKSYSLAASNAAGSSPTTTFSVNWQAVGGDGTPVCTLSPTSLTPAVGSMITINSTCTGNPTSYKWTGCALGAKSCITQSNTAGPITYTLRASNAAGVGTPASVTINWGGVGTPPPPPPAPACTVSASSATPQVGGSVTLTANCTNSPASYAWTNCTSTGATCTDSSQAAGAKTYSVLATNGGGSSAPASVSVNWQAAPPPAPVPVCSVAASNATPAAGSSVTLTATCTNTPTSYAWTNCSSTTNVCATTNANAGTVSYQVVATNGGGNSAPASVSVNWQGTAPSCRLTTSNALPTVGNNITLSAVCSGGTPTSYQWTGCASAGSTCTTTAQAPGTATYSVVASNDLGSAPAASVSVNWQAAGAGTCNGWPSFDMGTLNFTGERAFSETYYDDTHGFGNHMVAVITLHVPASAVAGSTSNLAIYEYLGPSTFRRAWVSKTRCDLSAARPAYTADSGPHLYFSVGVAKSGMVTVQPGETWYLMITNQSDVMGSIRDSCGYVSDWGGKCEIGVTVYPFQ